MSRTVVVAAGMLGACAVVRPAPLLDGLASGDRAYAAGRFAEAASAYERASLVARTAADRVDARYRAAMACRRGGDDACAARLLAVPASSGAWDARSRIAFEGAARVIRDGASGDVAAAVQTLDALITEEPSTGPARSALRVVLEHLDAQDPSSSGSIAWLAGVAARPTVRATQLLESVLAERAVRLASRGDAASAAAVWRECLATVPYPDNSHWDDGHVALARLERGAGDPRGAIATLDRMLAVLEASWGNGSYDAPRFAEGAMLRAEILRDDLGDPRAAADAFHRVYAQHRSSRLRDDALWSEAVLRRGFDAAGACAVMRTLFDEFPCQRFGERARRGLGACGGSPSRPARCGPAGEDQSSSSATSSVSSRSSSSSPSKSPASSSSPAASTDSNLSSMPTSAS